MSILDKELKPTRNRGRYKKKKKRLYPAAKHNPLKVGKNNTNNPVPSYYKL